MVQYSYQFTRPAPNIDRHQVNHVQVSQGEMMHFRHGVYRLAVCKELQQFRDDVRKSTFRKGKKQAE
jgi:hypothetical protein